MSNGVLTGGLISYLTSDLSSGLAVYMKALLTWVKDGLCTYISSSHARLARERTESHGRSFNLIFRGFDSTPLKRMTINAYALS